MFDRHAVTRRTWLAVVAGATICGRAVAQSSEPQAPERPWLRLDRDLRVEGVDPDGLWYPLIVVAESGQMTTITGPRTLPRGALARLASMRRAAQFAVDYPPRPRCLGVVPGTQPMYQLTAGDRSIAWRRLDDRYVDARSLALARRLERLSGLPEPWRR